MSRTSVLTPMLRHSGVGAFVILVVSACASLALPEGIPGVPVPLAATAVVRPDIDLASVLKRAGDLPGGLSGGEVKDGAPPEWAVLGVPDADAAGMQIFEKNGQPKGSVIISLYESRPMLEQATSALAYTMTRAGEIFGELKQFPADVGEKAIFVPANEPGSSTGLLFVRCHALVYVHLETGKTDTNPVTAYAQRLDTLLKPLVCW